MAWGLLRGVDKDSGGPAAANFAAAARRQLLQCGINIREIGPRWWLGDARQVEFHCLLALPRAKNCESAALDPIWLTLRKPSGLRMDDGVMAEDSTPLSDCTAAKLAEINLAE